MDPLLAAQSASTQRGDGSSCSSTRSHRRKFSLSLHEHDTNLGRSVPFGVVALVLAVVGMPKNFPYHGQQNRPPMQIWSRATLSKMDTPGFILLVMATLSFTACFQEADSRFPWRSAFVMTLLIGTVVIWSALLWWERRVTLGETLREPVLPWRFIQNRAMVGILLCEYPITVQPVELSSLLSAPEVLCLSAAP